MDKPDILKQIEEILAGIDKTETDDDKGWWEISTGAEFGKDKLNQIRLLFKDKP